MINFQGVMGIYYYIYREDDIALLAETCVALNKNIFSFFDVKQIMFLLKKNKRFSQNITLQTLSDMLKNVWILKQDDVSFSIIKVNKSLSYISNTCGFVFFTSLRLCFVYYLK